MYAVVGLDCLLPGALTVDAWLSLARPQIREVFADRWLGSEPPLSTRRGAFVEGHHFDASRLCAGHLAPFESLDPLFGWVAHTTHGALSGTRRGRTGLVLASLGLPSSGHVRAIARAWPGESIRWPWLSREQGGDPLDHAQFVAPAQLAAQALQLDGPVETLDAACASGLYAVRSAMDVLARGEADCMVAAAVNRSDSAYLFHGFSALRALSISGTPRPLDTRADGLVVGEGAVAIAIKRLEDAIRDGDRVHAVIRAVALGSDGRKGNMLAPSQSGQLATMQRAWRSAGLDPATVGLVECHATGTPIGDGLELRALGELLAHRVGEAVVLHACKALVGHTVTAAGLAGLLRAIGAVRDGQLPASVSCEFPREELAKNKQMTILREPIAWEGPRRAAVSAFGFGGTNAHLIVEAFHPGDPGVPQMPRTSHPLAIVAMEAAIGDLSGAPLMDAIRASKMPMNQRMTKLTIDPSRFRIPPTELAAFLPQQLLALDLAARLAEETPLSPSHTASVIGIEVDPAIGDVVLRWGMLAAGRPREADALCPPLSASRVQGSLPNFVANRIAAQLDLQGPSFVVAGGEAAIRQASRLLDDPELHAVLVGAVDCAGASPGRTGDACVVLLLQRLEDARASGSSILAELHLREQRLVPPAPPSGLGAAEELVSIATAVMLQRESTVASITVRPIRAPRPPPRPVAGSLEIKMSQRQPAYDGRSFFGTFGGQTVPRPLPRVQGANIGDIHISLVAAETERAPLRWPVQVPRPASSRTAVLAQSIAVFDQTAAIEQRPVEYRAPLSVEGRSELARSVARSVAAVAETHARFLEAQERAMAPLVSLGEALSRAAHLSGAREAPADDVVLPRPRFDRAALQRHASAAPLSEIFGSRYRDLDEFEPRVRMPMPPLLLCDRVITIEGERGQFGPARIVTEYDVPAADWTADGRPPAFVIVESGQADLFLVSWLGIDEVCRGERRYRLLDCDLEFIGPRPSPGATLRHDIRIDRFASLGKTTLFYFHYDCIDVATGAPVLRMRNGCAGFFTRDELARPRGLQASTTLQPVRALQEPRLGPVPSSLGESEVCELAAGHFSSVFGPAFADADGSKLTLPASNRWRLVHRVLSLSLEGGVHGLGEVIFEQDLRDEDWFNPVHFVGDPCMPGTLMLEGCLQAVQIWLIAQGVSVTHFDGVFEVVSRSIRLRCRGQVAPGHRVLRYHARIIEAGFEPEPYAIADVILSVDGTDVVAAYDVGVRVSGEGRPLPEIASPQMAEVRLDRCRVLEFSVGSAVRAFGPWYKDADRRFVGGPGRRCARMPGPPLLQMSEVLSVEGPPQEVAASRAVTIAYDIPPDAWFWRADTLGTMPFVILLETALQPCGWLTAWQGQGLLAEDLYFRNLGGVGTQHAAVRPDTGRVLTTARQTAVATLGGMQIQRFSVEVCAEKTGERLFSCETQFGYFTPAALDNQKGLPNTQPMVLPRVDLSLVAHPALPRGDLRMIDRLIGADPSGGAAGLGQYVANKAIDPGDWYFTAHFWLDPVMPGSLGLEAMLQLARVVFCERTGYGGPLEVLPLGTEVSWTYRGQVRTHNREVRVEIEILSLSPLEIRCRGVLRADDLPIYIFESFGVRVSSPALPAPIPPPSPGLPRVTALLDTFEVHESSGIGVMSLDPSQHPWLDAHRPTMTVAAVPLAFVAEIAAEAAQQLARGGERPVGLPLVQIDRWIEERDGELQVAAVRDGAHVAVTLGVGGEARAKAIVSLGEGFSPEVPPLVVEGERVDIAGSTFFASGRTFHGPLLQAMASLDLLGPSSASASLRTRADRDLIGISGHLFRLDPLLIDAATHPMLSGEPERWHASVGSGQLAYPVRIEDLRLYGPRPEGIVEVRVSLVAPSPSQTLVFDVQLCGAQGLWCSYRWHERLVAGGPLLGAPPAVRRRFLWEQKGDARVWIGHAHGEGGWRVRAGDLIEPLAGTHAALYRASGPVEIAVKELVRHRVRTEHSEEIHPADIEIVELRPGWYIVTAVSSLRADQYVAWLHPTHFAVRVASEGPTVLVHSSRLP